MKNLFYFLSLSVFIFLSTSLITFASIPEGISLTKTSSGYIFDFNLPSFELTNVLAEGAEYSQLLIEEYGITPEVGLPALPLISFNIYINDAEAQPGFQIENILTEERILKHKIYPFQMPWEKSKPLDERPFTINQSYYSSNGNMDQPFVKISQPFVIAGVKGVTITLYPFKYNPKDDKLVFIKSGRVNILLDNQILPVTDKSSKVESYFRSVFVNYEGNSQRSASKYLIITAPSFESGMQQFVAHKISNSFEVDMFNTSITGTTTTAIKSFIQQRYNDPSTKPEFVLLVGDVAQIPSWTGTGAGSPQTDVNYVQLEGGDYFADAFIGRFSVATTAQLQNAINKSIFMENYIGTLSKKNIYMASTDNWQISEGTHNYIINQYFEPASYTNLKLFTYTYGATTTQLINALNDNQVFAIYSGHGSETSWADGPPLNQSQVSGLTNTWYPFVYSFACVTGSYHISECFGETWLRTEHGASTFYGSSVNSYWDEDDILERKIFQAMFDDGLTRVTPMFDMGKIYLVNYYGGVIGTGTTTLRYVEMYNLMGDPSMPVVEMGPPCPIDAASNPDPVHNATNLPISGNNLSWVNGNGSSQIEVWFGEVGNLVQVYSGSPITTFSLASYEPLNYNTTYSWQIKGLNDTCSVPGSVWKFTTMQDPNLVQWCDEFNSLGNWTIVGPLGMTNWSSNNSGSSGGTAPELRMSWTPSFDGESKIRSMVIPLPDNQLMNYSFNYYFDWYANPSGTITVAVTYDGGLTTTPLYNQVDATGNVGPTVISGNFTTPATGAANTQIEITFIGYSFNNDNIYWDNMTLEYVVPVELVSFEASAKGSAVELNWITSTETNNMGFEIERSQTSNVKSQMNWERIGYVAGYGTTTETKAYSFVDDDVDAGIYSYRLKQIDFDGSFSYSSEIEVDITGPKDFALMQNYPNPFNPSTTINIALPVKTTLTLAVYNLLGEQVETIFSGELDGGFHEFQFNGIKLPSGVYFYRFESEQFNSVKKMVIMK